jgi:hypothetical protein
MKYLPKLLIYYVAYCREPKLSPNCNLPQCSTSLRSVHYRTLKNINYISTIQFVRSTFHIPENQVSHRASIKHKFDQSVCSHTSKNYSTPKFNKYQNCIDTHKLNIVSIHVFIFLVILATIQSRTLCLFFCCLKT